jgi:hypothetical protein
MHDDPIFGVRAGQVDIPEIDVGPRSGVHQENGIVNQGVVPDEWPTEGSKAHDANTEEKGTGKYPLKNADGNFPGIE